MSRIGIRIGLDTGDLVSSAGRARQSIAELTAEMKKAEKEGRYGDHLRLSLDRDRLQGKTAGFERDIRTLYNDPRFRTALPNGATGLRIDPEYAAAIKSHNEAMKKLTDEFHEATRAGNVDRVRELTPQIEKEQSEFHKTIRDIIKTGGDFSQRPPSPNDAPDGQRPPAPPLPNNGDWRGLKGLSGAITREHGLANWERVARLGTTKDALRGVMGQYDRDGKLQTKIKADPELAAQLKEVRDALKGTIAAINDAAANGDYEKVDQLTGQAKQLQGISHNIAQEASAPTDSKKAQDAMLASFLNVQTAQQMIGAVTSGINTYVAHLDRSGIVNAMGGGDVMGAQIEELHRSAAEKSSLWGSIGRVGGGILGGIAGTFIGGPGIGTAAGMALGSTLGGAGGDLVGTLGDEKKANKMATDEAYAKLWERQAPAAMELAGMLGKYGGSTEENTRAIRRTWESAANTATEYGFSPEEGVEQVKQAAAQGLSERRALDAARDVFAFERGTGADRGVLSEFRNRTERFGVANGLNTAWRGNQASGMAPGQFNEFLRSMQRTFEDGISKGFVRGAGEIAGNLSFLSGLNGGGELWKGEQGANRLSQMNSGLEATTALSSASDILSFRGAQNLLKRWDAEGDAKERWKAIGDLDPTKEGLELRRGYDYIDSMAILERGLTPELFHSQMQMIEGVEGKGNRTGAVEQMRNIYGLNYTGSAALYQSYQDKLKTFNGDSAAAEKYFSGDEWAKKLEDFKANPDYNNSKELAMFGAVADIKKYTYEIGQWHLDAKMDDLQNALVAAWREAAAKGVTDDATPGNSDDPFPPKEEPTPPKPFNYDDATPEELREKAAEFEAQGRPGVARGYSDEADNREELLIREINGMAGRATSNLFAENIGDDGLPLLRRPADARDEGRRMEAINDTVSGALRSGDPAQFNAAREIAETLIRYGGDRATGYPYNQADTFNLLAEFSGNAILMLNALRGVVEELNKSEVTVEAH